jgi:hypothetical protein
MKSSNPIIPAMDKAGITAGVVASLSRVCSLKRISEYLSVPVDAYRYTMPRSMKTSPMRVVINAFTAASRVEGRANQKPINRYEQSPMISQPMNSSSKLFASTIVSMPKAKSEMNAKKRAYIGSTPPLWGGKPFLSSGSLSFPKFWYPML